MELDVVTPSIFKMAVSSFHDCILRTQISLITFPTIQKFQILNEYQASVDADIHMMMVWILIDFFPPRKNTIQNYLQNFAHLFPAHLCY